MFRTGSPVKSVRRVSRAPDGMAYLTLEPLPHFLLPFPLSLLPSPFTLTALLKVELHAHTDEDPSNDLDHTSRQLIDHAASLGYGALAGTLHDRYFDPSPHVSYARDRGIVLMSGIERTVERRHVLLINFPAECATIRSFAELTRLKSTTQGL